MQKMATGEYDRARREAFLCSKRGQSSGEVHISVIRCIVVSYRGLVIFALNLCVS